MARIRSSEFSGITGAQLVAHAQKINPECVQEKGLPWYNKLSVSFDDNFDFFGIENVLSFQDSIKNSAGVRLRIIRVYSGCIEVDFSVSSGDELTEVQRFIKMGKFDSIAYVHKVQSVEFRSCPDLGRFVFARDGLGR